MSNFFNDLVDSIHTQTKTFLNTLDPSESFTKAQREQIDANAQFCKSWADATYNWTEATKAAAIARGK